MSQPKQLKKTDFLSHVTEEPMTRGDLVDALEEYNFINSYFDYLFEHFVTTGKIIVNDNDTFQLKPKKSATPKDAYRVVENGEFEYDIEHKEITGLLDDEDKALGWATTKNAAVKKACSLIFSGYKDRTAAVKALLANG